MPTIEELRAQLDEARQRLNDLTRNLDESPSVEGEEESSDEIQAARSLVVRLEREIEEAEAKGKS